MTIRGFVNRPKVKKEKLSSVSKVEKAGYVPLKKRVEEMVLAGQRLQQTRKEQYDTVDGSEPTIDPTRRPGFDMADASVLMRETTRRLKAQQSKKGEGGVSPPAPLPETPLTAPEGSKKGDS